MDNSPKTYLIQDFVPYDQSLKWKIQDNYYQNRGNQAWLSGEVPYQITSNSVAARQNVELVFTAIENMEKNGILKENDPIRILEMASGLGLFAINFINEFKRLDKRHKKTYSQRLKYIFTDYSQVNLDLASQNKTLKEFLDTGKLEFIQTNAISLENIKSPLVAVIANYLHCCLPTKIIQKKDDQLFEKYLKLTSNIYIYKPIQNLQITDLIEESSWINTNSDIFINNTHQKTIEECLTKYSTATLTYPFGSFISIENSLQKLYTGGIIIISDKGYINSEIIQGENKCEPSIHGNSFAHSLNLPLLKIFAHHLGYDAIHTTDPYFPLHTILIEKRPNGLLHNKFKQLFNKNNKNIIASDFFQAGLLFSEKKEYLTSIRFFEHEIKLGVRDSSVYYRLGWAYFEIDNQKLALQTLNLGKKLNYFSKYDFNFITGYIYDKLGNYKKAINYYSNANTNKLTQKELNIINFCHEKLI